MKKNLYTLLLVLATQILFAGSFTPGNIVVVRLGDGSAALSSAATLVYLDEFTPAGSLVQSVALPAAASGSNHILTMSGTATSEGSLTLSVNGQLLVLGGYDAAPGLASVSSDSTANRTVAAISANGTVNTATGFLAGSAYKKNNIRGAVTQDGTAFWCAGAGGSTGGTWYIPAGSFINSAVQVSSTITTTRNINIFGNQLYTSCSSSSYHGVNAVGTGVPVITGQTSTNLPGMPGADTSSSAYGFYFFDLDPGTPGLDVLYVCDDHTGSTGGVLKYSLVGGTWVSNGSISSAAGLRGITGYASCAGVHLFVSGQGGVFSLSDASGYNQTITGSLNQLVTPATNTVIRGIAFAPGTTPPTGLQVSVTGSNITCNGTANGSVSTTVTGGTTPYTYNWGAGITTQNRNNLSPGTYSVTVTDAGSCTGSASASITEPNLLSASATETDVTCNSGNNGAVNLSVTGGTTPYTYNWGGGVTTQNRTAIIAGTYTVTVTDNHSCSATASSTVNQPNPISIVPTVTNLPCTGGANTGAVNITVSGGTSGYSYLWSSNAGNATTQNITGLNAGTYTVTITDAATCTATLSAIVSQSGSLTIVPTVTEVTCFGAANGSITITTSGGTPPYNYTWSTTPQTNLGPGSYVVTVTDNGGCTLINSIDVTQPAVLAPVVNTVNVNCYGQTDGSANLSVTGGTTPYSYLWNTNVVTQNLTSLGAASYSVTVTDSNSCTITASAVVTQPDSISITGAVTNASAFGASDGSISLTVSGGTPSYTYAWNSGTGADNTSLASGNYCVTITDTHTCSVSDCFTVSQPSGITETDVAEKFIVYQTGDYLFVNAELQSAVTSAVQVRDIMGRVLFNSIPETTSLIQMQIPFGRISSGWYIVTIVTEQGAISKKIIVTR